MLPNDNLNMFSENCPFCKNQLIRYHYHRDNELSYDCDDCDYHLTFDYDTGHLYSESFEIDNYIIENCFIKRKCLIFAPELKTNIHKILTTLPIYISPTISLETLKSYIIMA